MDCCEDGRGAIERSGFSYLPRFIEEHEAAQLIDYFGGLSPLWEQRHAEVVDGRGNQHGRRLTRPVYWLGAWQFASLGYYAEPHYRRDRCVRAEPFPSVMQAILERLGPVLREYHFESRSENPCARGGEMVDLPNTCLINYYGREVGQGPPRDYARLRMHRDGEPGPVVMFSIGQPGRLEFLDPTRSPEPELMVWTRHRSVTILSGPEFKDRLYHRVTEVRTGQEPRLKSRVDNFETRRISVSFRHVPDELITPYRDLPLFARQRVRPYMETLAGVSAYFEAELEGMD